MARDLIQVGPSPGQILSRYDVVESTIEIAPGRSVRLAHVRDINALVDSMTEADFGPDERLPYWAVLWPSAPALSRVLLEELQPEASPVLELGAGLALCSIALAAAGFRVLATDHEPDALAFARHNAELNGVEIDTAPLDFRDFAALGAGPFRTIVAADVLYEARKVEPLADTIAALLAPGGEAWVADPRRPHLGAFDAALRDRGFVTRPRKEADVDILRVSRVLKS